MGTIAVHIIGGPRDGEVHAVDDRQRTIDFAVQRGDRYEHVSLPIRKWREQDGQRIYKVDGAPLG